MSPEEYNKFMKDLTGKVALKESEITNGQSLILALESKPATRKLEEGEIVTILTATEIICSLAVAVVARESTDSQSAGVFGASMGALGGIPVSITNCNAFRSKPFCNWLNKMRVYGIRKKIEKLENNKFKYDNLWNWLNNVSIFMLIFFVIIKKLPI